MAPYLEAWLGKVLPYHGGDAGVLVNQTWPPPPVPQLMTRRWLRAPVDSSRSGRFYVCMTGVGTEPIDPLAEFGSVLRTYRLYMTVTGVSVRSVPRWSCRVSYGVHRSEAGSDRVVDKCVCFNGQWPMANRQMNSRLAC